MSLSPIRAMSPISPSRAQQTKIQDIRSKIIRNNVEQKQPLSPLKSGSLRFNDHTTSPFAPVGKVAQDVSLPSVPPSSTLTPSTTSVPSTDIEWKHPDLTTIEHRLVNKELELKRVLINFILLLLSKLVLNFANFFIYKLEINFSFDPFTKYLYLIHLVFIWNIGSGIYKVLKPQDDFKDLNLTEQQRSLLGLTPIPLKTSTTSVSYKTSTTPSELTNSISPSKPIVNDNEHKRIKTPIASPMSSQPVKRLNFSPKKSPLKFETSTKSTTSTTSTTVAASALQTSNPLLTKIKQSVVSTPTYIPSPKYYYRMDSPTKARRRV